MSIQSKYHKVVIDQGATWNLYFTWTINNTPVNLTGYTAALQVRGNVRDTTAQLSLSTGSGIVLGGSAGTVSATATPTQTRALLPGKAVWDIELTSPGGEVTRLLHGDAEITPEVTR